MYIQELWRYPVKSLAGEQIQEVELTLHGMFGDRVVHVRDARGRVVTSRTKPLSWHRQLARRRLLHSMKGR